MMRMIWRGMNKCRRNKARKRRDGRVIAYLRLRMNELESEFKILRML